MEKRKRLPLKIRIFNTIVNRRERGKLPPRECKYRLRVRHQPDCVSHKLMECDCRAKVWLVYRRRPPCGVQLSEHTPLRHYWHWLGDREETARKLGSPFFKGFASIRIRPRAG